MKTIACIALILSAFITTLSGQNTPPPVCDITCNGGDPPPGGGGGPIQTMTSVNNQRGLGGPRGASQAAGSSVNVEGSQSYTYGVPLFALLGRNKLNLNLTLYYNSLLWQYNIDNNSMVYGGEFQFPGPGFSLGYGLVDFAVDFSVGILVEPNGGSHLLVPTGTTNLFRTTDSSYIQAQYPSQAGGPVIVTLKDGTRTFYQPFTVLVNNHTEYRPYQVEDTNGNIISIAYANPNNLNISTITDTVGRVIQFTYDSTGTQLQSVGQLDNTGHVFRQYSFAWAQAQTLNFNFNLKGTAGLGLTPGFLTSGQTKVNLLSKVTRPDGTAVTFDYVHDGSPNGNSDWGIVKTVSELSSMGAVRYSTSYLFPAASAGALTANPTYTQQTVFDGVNTGVWTYQATQDSNGLVTSFVTTDPCGNTNTTTFSSNGDALDGLPISEQLMSPQTPTGVSPFGGCPVTTAQTWRTVNKTWTTDADGSNARLASVVTILEDGSTQSEADFHSYDANGNVTDTLQYDFGSGTRGPLLREFVISYASLGNGINNRVSRSVVKDGSGNTVSRTDFNYDGYGTSGLSDISPNPVGHDAAFTTANTARGNITSMVRYANASAGTGGITSTFAYDIVGNVLTSQVGCCTSTSQNFSAATNYAYPDSVVKGPSGNPLSLTTSFTYNLLAGTVSTSTDPNGQKTTYTYDAENRNTSTQLPDGNVVSQAYDDADASRGVTTSNTLNSMAQVNTMDGLGKTILQQVKNGTTLVSTQAFVNDVLGRQISVSNPYGPSETPVYTNYQYDTLGRATSVTRPGNMGSSQASYGTAVLGSGDPFLAAGRAVRTVTSTDPAGKQGKQYTNSMGKVVQVDEPGPSGGVAGSGSVSISGTEGSVSVQNGGGATAGTGSVSVSGSERSTVILTHAATQASVSVTIGGSEVNNNHSSTVCTGGPPSRLPPTCHTITSNPPDTGTVQFSVTVSGTTFGPYSVSYGASSTTSSLAAGLAGAFPANGLVTLSYGGGSSFTLTTTAASSAMNSSTLSTSVATSCVPSFIDNGTGGSSSTNCNGPGWTITPSQNFAGGSDNVNTTFYDTGAVTASVTINGTVYSKSSSYGQNSTAGSIASDLASQINSDTTLDKLLIASAAGGVLSLTTTATGAGTADPLSVTSATNSQYFAAGSTSFPVAASGATLTPGQNGVVFDAGTVTLNITGFTATPFKKTVNYSQGSTGSSVASSLAGAFNADSVSPVTASASGASISLTAKTLGSDTNYGVQVAAATTQTAYFSQPSFGGSPVSLAGGQDPGASLSTPLSTTYFYNAMGRLLQITQGAQQRVFQYDDVGRVISAKVPETQNQATIYSYNDEGLNQQTDPRGIVTTMGYDALARISQITYSDQTPSVTYTYGAQGAANFGGGRITKIVDGSGTANFQYDAMGRVAQISSTIGSQTYTTGYTYTNEEISRITYPSGRTVDMGADAIGRLSTIGSNGSNLLTVGSYNAAGEILSSTYGNGMNATYTYNSQLQLASLVTGSATTPVLNLTYSYGSNNNGQIQSITDGINPSQSVSYSYDELGRLKTAGTNDVTSPNTWHLKFCYDRYGNRLCEVPTAGTSAMPFSEASVDPTTNRINGLQYDAAGNLTNDGIHTYTYNAQNKITQVDGAGSFIYDASGRRVSKNGTVYIYHNGSVIAEYPNGAAPSSPSVEYVGQIASFAGGVTTYRYSDHLSIRALANASGGLTGNQTQFPFGELVPGLQTGTTTKWQFTTYERDNGAGESGNDYALARFYASRLGRFTSVDPLSGSISDPQSLNRYAYFDPTNSTDPSGMLHGRLTCLLDNFGNCVGGNGYAPGQGGWGDAQLLTNDSMHIFSDPFGEWVDPTKWDPLAEAEAQYDTQVKANQVMNQTGTNRAVVVTGPDGVVHVAVYMQVNTELVYHPPDADHPNGYFSTSVTGHWFDVTVDLQKKEDLDPMNSVVDYIKWTYQTAHDLQNKPGGPTFKEALKYVVCDQIAQQGLSTKFGMWLGGGVGVVAGAVAVFAPPSAPVAGPIAAAGGLYALVSGVENYVAGEANKAVGCGFK